MAQIEILKDSQLGLKGSTPSKREGASKESQLHVKVNGTSFSRTSGQSTLDLDGKKPETYRDTAPEGSTF